MFESVCVGRSLTLSLALSSSPSASLWLRPDMTGADLGHRVCLVELGSAAASSFLFASVLSSGQGLSLGPRATLTLERSSHFGWSLRMGMQTGPADWSSRVGRVYDGTDRRWTGIQAFSADFSAWEPGMALANDGVNSPQKNHEPGSLFCLQMRPTLIPSCSTQEFVFFLGSTLCPNENDPSTAKRSRATVF